MTHIVILFVPSVYADDWPQVQHDPQHTGYSPETLGINFRVAWTYPFQPDRVHPQTQAIIYQGKVFVGTEGANGQAAAMYALDAVNPEAGTNPPKGRIIWRTPINEPIINSVAADNGMIFFGTMEGAIYALDADDGHQIWKQQVSVRHGFSTAPVIGDNKILIGGRDGYFYALNPVDGVVLWKYNTSSPILHTAAYNNGKVFFGTMDMYIYALNTTPSNINNPETILAWKSPKINGIAFFEYWPVVTQGRVIIRPLGGPNWGLHTANYNESTQNQVLANYDNNPSAYPLSLVILDENTGQMTPSLQIIHWDAPTQAGTAPPPCVDKDGNIIVQAPAPDSWQAGWARASLTTRKIFQPLYDGTYNGINFSGYGNEDENLNVTCSQNLIINFHSEESGAQYNGYFDLNTNRWTFVPDGRLNREMLVPTERQGNNPPTISNGMVYHISLYQVIARTTN